MIITYHGGRCVRLQSGDVSLIADPTSNRFKADVVINTEYKNETDPSLSLDEISHAGEYEISDITINGIQQKNSPKGTVRTIYAVEWESIRFAFLGCLSETPDIATMEQIGEVDVLIFCVGGTCIAEKDAASLVKKLSPSLVIPLIVKGGGEFLKAVGRKAAPQEKMVFKKKDLVPEAQTVVLLDEK